MKRIVTILTAATALLLAASCSRETAPVAGNATVTFQIAPEILTKATGDGAAAKDLFVAVFDEDGAEIPALRQHIGNASYPQAVTLSLVKDFTYKVCFLAQSEGAYITEATADLKGIALPYGAMNSEALDLFTAISDITVGTQNNISVTLKRPFARVNFATTTASIAAAAQNGFTVTKVKATFSDLPISFSLFDGALSGKQNVTFTEAAPVNETLHETFTTLAYAYLPAAEDSYLTNASLDLNDGARTITVANLPIKSNYRTNVLGNLLTSDVNYSVNLDPNFATEENNVSLEDQANLNSIISQINAGTFTGTKIELNPTMAGVVFDFEGLENPLTVPVEINGTNTIVENLTAESAIEAKPAVTVMAGASATIDNADIKSTIANTTSDAGGGRALNIEGGANVTITNSTIDGSKNAYSRGLNIYDEGATVVVKNSEIKGTYAINTPGSGKNISVTINDSEISGWSIINVWNANNNFTFTNCTLNSINDYPYNADGWNNFAAVVFNGGAENNLVTATDCNINVKATTGNKQFLASIRAANNALSVKGNSVITATDVNTTSVLGVSSMEIYYSTTLDIDDTVVWAGDWAE